MLYIILITIVIGVIATTIECIYKYNKPEAKEDRKIRKLIQEENMIYPDYLYKRFFSVTLLDNIEAGKYDVKIVSSRKHENGEYTIKIIDSNNNSFLGYLLGDKSLFNTIDSATGSLDVPLYVIVVTSRTGNRKETIGSVYVHKNLLS